MQKTETKPLPSECYVVAPDGLLAASPIVKQPATVAYRVVLREGNNGGFVVHDEHFPNWPSLDDSYLSNGSYCGLEGLPLAMARFAERVARQGETTQSIYR